jgi:hypothetical protein
VLRLDGALDEGRASMGEIQSGVKPPQSKKTGSDLNFLKMITFAPSREVTHEALRLLLS